MEPVPQFSGRYCDEEGPSGRGQCEAWSSGREYNRRKPVTDGLTFSNYWWINEPSSNTDVEPVAARAFVPVTNGLTFSNYWWLNKRPSCLDEDRSHSSTAMQGRSFSNHGWMDEPKIQSDDVNRKPVTSGHTFGNYWWLNERLPEVHVDVEGTDRESTCVRHRFEPITDGQNFSNYWWLNDTDDKGLCIAKRRGLDEGYISYPESDSPSLNQESFKDSINAKRPYNVFEKPIEGDGRSPWQQRLSLDINIDTQKDSHQSGNTNQNGLPHTSEIRPADFVTISLMSAKQKQPDITASFPLRSCDSETEVCASRKRRLKKTNGMVDVDVKMCKSLTCTEPETGRKKVKVRHRNKGWRQ